METLHQALGRLAPRLGPGQPAREPEPGCMSAKARLVSDVGDTGQFTEKSASLLMSSTVDSEHSSPSPS